MGVKGPQGRKTYLAGAFPSACGKTSTAMLPGETILGDDIAYFRALGGKLRAVNAESGIFGIIQDVNPVGDPAIYKSLSTPGEVIFSNILVKDGKPYWLGMGRDLPKEGINFTGKWFSGKKDAKGYPIGNSVTADIAIRKAINLGLDRKALVDAVLLGHGTPAYGPADDLPWSNPDARVDEDVEGAKALLDKAGWVPGGDGVRVKDGLRAAFPVIYPSTDSVRQGLAVMLSEQMKPLGIEITPKGDTWEGIERAMHASPVMFGWGSHSPEEVYSLYQSGFAGIDYYNAGYFANAAVDAHFADAQAAPSLEASYPFWKQAEWDGKTGFSAKGDAGWAWMVNLDHVYFVGQCLDIGKTQIEPHGHGWPVTATIQNWKWTCQ